MLGFLLAASLTVAALPAAEPGRRVYDLDGVLGASAQAQLDGEIAAVERETSAQMAVVTIHSLDGETVEGYANRLFNAWGIGSRGRNNGVLFLVAPSERRARIEVGYGLEPLLSDEVCGDILAEVAIPRFKSGDYEGGIVAATLSLASILRRYPDAARGIPGSAPLWIGTPRRNALAASVAVAGAAIVLGVIGGIFRRRRRYPRLVFPVGGVCLLAMAGVAAGADLALADTTGEKWLWLALSAVGSGLALAINWRAYRRFGPHACPKCGTRLVLLDRAKEDEKLDAAQRIEEQIGSVDYDVWVCPSCLATDTERYLEWFSDFDDCPACGHRTYKSERTVVEEPTYDSYGRARIDSVCVSCKHRASQIKVIPMLTRSASSGFGGGLSLGGGGGSGGGGGFGGGSSGGGGASGSW